MNAIGEVLEMAIITVVGVVVLSQMLLPIFVLAAALVTVVFGLAG